MNLTKHEALQWHKKMWIWIAREIASHKKVMDIGELKDEFINNELGNYAIVRSSCFCCQYAIKIKRISRGDGFKTFCDYCPIDWGCKTNAFMCEDKNKGGDGLGLWWRCRLCYYNKNKGGWKKQSKLAYKIAMLPERKDE